MGKGWGYDRQHSMALYKTVFLPKILYGVEIWSSAAKHWQGRQMLNNIQRRPLLGISSAYNTTSTLALQVITGTLPLDLEAQLKALLMTLRDSPPEAKERATAEAWQSVYDTWQLRWQNSDKGRWTYLFFPSVRTRSVTPIWLNHRLSQMLTGHGNFNGKLHKFNLSDNPLCSCGSANEDAEHILFNCSKFVEPRARLELAVHRSGNLCPCSPHILVSSKSLYTALDTFCNLVLDQ